MKRAKREAIDFTRLELPEGWKFLETEFSSELSRTSFYRDQLLHPNSEEPTKIIVTIGEWNQDLSSEHNQFFVRCSKHCYEDVLEKSSDEKYVVKYALDQMSKTDKMWKDKFVEYNKHLKKVYASSNN